jgi:hypothetical protein
VFIAAERCLPCRSLAVAASIHSTILAFNYHITCSFTGSVVQSICVGFQFLAAVLMKNPIFWKITPCSLLKIIRCFGGTCCFHLQDRRVSQAGNQHEDIWGSGDICGTRSEWSASHCDRYNLGGKISGTHCIGGCVGPRACLDVMERRKIFPCRESNPDHSPSPYRLSYPDYENKDSLYIVVQYLLGCHYVLKKKL